MARKLPEQSHELTLCLSGMGQERREIIIRTFRDDTCILHGAHRHMIPREKSKTFVTIGDRDDRENHLFTYILTYLGMYIYIYIYTHNNSQIKKGKKKKKKRNDPFPSYKSKDSFHRLLNNRRFLRRQRDRSTKGSLAR